VTAYRLCPTLGTLIAWEGYGIRQQYPLLLKGVCLWQTVEQPLLEESAGACMPQMSE